MKNRQKFSKMLAQRSRRQKKLWFLTVILETKRSSDRSSFSPITSLKKQMKGGFNGTSFGKAISLEMPNEQLERKTVTGNTGKLKAEKNGWRNRMNQPVIITVV
jgi:hypothetical protein